MMKYFEYPIEDSGLHKLCIYEACTGQGLAGPTEMRKPHAQYRLIRHGFMFKDTRVRYATGKSECGMFHDVLPDGESIFAHEWRM